MSEHYYTAKGRRPLSVSERVYQHWMRLKPYAVAYAEALAIAAVLAMPWALWFANWD